MSEKEKISKPFEGHRERLRRRFEESKFKGFQEYEVLELLLTFVLPKIDTKPIARNLLNKFHSLNGVLSAEIQDLESIKGIKRRSAVFLKIMNSTIAYYFESKAKNEEIQITKLSELFAYLKATIGGRNNEIFKTIYLNSQNKIINTEELSEGTVNETIAFPRKVVEGAIKNHATTVILAHNHPGGLPQPSENDNLITEQINSALKTINVFLQDHIIISEDGFFSFKREGLLD